jgi:hypothetical protein
MKDLKEILAQEDTSAQRFRNRIRKIHDQKYYKNWKSKPIIGRLYTSSHLSPGISDANLYHAGKGEY